MRNLNELNKFRVCTPSVMAVYGSYGDHENGCFHLPGQVSVSRKTKRAPLHIVASIGDGWEHVSVSTDGRCPTWDEMSFVHRLFFKPDEEAMQLHVPQDEHINCHPYTLHLWRPAVAGRIPRPPEYMIGPKT